MVKKIHGHKSDKKISPDFGNWKLLGIDLDSFSDGKTNLRIEQYISNCLDNFDNGLEINDVINIANKKYGKTWGNENINEF